ncbi:DUF6292 family protein [Streptomyces sp. Qhu-G9]|uniref:DUF6292 family protein n=1 Tax=Streptomyces sp. Qhu-G9 TaxID=3452799 RepID=UPI0022AC7771|nr:DUF6292 family protein [Streptomyces aurantiacus]WAU82386.1 DUF6292 family protein [Streptomyces aurantiacus]
MLLNPPGLLRPGLLPHWPYAQDVDQALTDRAIPPGTVRVERTGRAYGELMYLVLAWDVSRCAGPGGLRLTWREDTGWSHTLLRTGGEAAIPRGPLTVLHRVYAAPEAVADVADALVSRRFRGYETEWHGEWERAHEVRTAIDAFREPVG